MRLFEMIDLADMLGRMDELEGDTLAMPVNWGPRSGADFTPPETVKSAGLGVGSRGYPI